ncbi:hypothetical protein LB465_02895 [Salegentibacter sp. LM13S]|uniref:hypothetical protein n=1 Tax=Salegentibacter lacus TaxID=2873599 RepID=UPI001CCF8150|nr:hypothetical protein [Salegentibacter lacus]MBZ9629713.1 hypothetical protein [Salegentibacter lacus]
MVSRKITYLILLLFLSINCYSQVNPIVYGGVDYFRNTGFKKNAYANINLGAQLLRWKFFAPEVGYEYHFGLVRNNEELNPVDSNARPPSILDTRFSSHTFSVAPKIIFGNEEAAFVFIPQYNFGKIRGRGDFLRDSGRQYYLVDQQIVKDNIHFCSFAAGVEGNFFDSQVLHFSLLIKYHLLNSEKILSQIDFEESALNSFGGSADGIGISFRVYLDLLQLLQRK